MTSLVVYYSRTGNTRKIAEELANALGCDIEEIIDTKNRSGKLAYLSSGRDARNRKLTVLKDIITDPSKYDSFDFRNSPLGWPCVSTCQDIYTPEPVEYQQSSFFLHSRR